MYVYSSLLPAPISTHQRWNMDRRPERKKGTPGRVLNVCNVIPSQYSHCYYLTFPPHLNRPVNTGNLHCYLLPCLVLPVLSQINRLLPGANGTPHTLHLTSFSIAVGWMGDRIQDRHLGGESQELGPGITGHRITGSLHGLLFWFADTEDHSLLLLAAWVIVLAFPPHSGEASHTFFTKTCSFLLWLYNQFESKSISALSSNNHILSLISPLNHYWPAKQSIFILFAACNLQISIS